MVCDHNDLRVLCYFRGRQMDYPGFSQENDPMIFQKPEDIADELVMKLGSDEREFLIEIGEDDLIMYHHTVGRYIRNEYGLWEENNPYSNKAGKHPDAVSQEIITMIWKKVQNEHHRKNQARPPSGT